MKPRDPDKREIEAYLIAAFRKRYGIALTPSAEFTQIGIDSVAMADLITELEDKFDIRVDQDIFDVDSIGALAAYMEIRLQANH